MSYKNAIKSKTKIDPTKKITFKIDKYKMLEGVAELYGVLALGDYNKRLKEATERKYGKKNNKQKDDINAFDMVIEFYPKYVITGWNLKDENGDIPFSEEGCRQLLEDLRQDHAYIFADIIPTFTNFEDAEIDEVLTREDGVNKGNGSGSV